MTPKRECVEIWQLISISVDGELCREDGHRLLEHINNCEEENCDLCKEILEDFYEIKSNLVRRKRKVNIRIKENIFAKIREMEIE